MTPARPAPKPLGLGATSTGSSSGFGIGPAASAEPARLPKCKILFHQPCQFGVNACVKEPGGWGETSVKPRNDFALAGVLTWCKKAGAGAGAVSGATTSLLQLPSSRWTCHPRPQQPHPLCLSSRKNLQGGTAEPPIPVQLGLSMLGPAPFAPAFSSKHRCLHTPSTFPWHPAPPPQLQFLASRGPCHMRVALQGSGLQIQRGPSRCNQLQQGTRAALASPDTRRFPTAHNKQP